MLAVTKVGRPKGTRVAVCTCGWRVTGKGKSATCTECKRRIAFPKARRSRPKEKASA